LLLFILFLPLFISQARQLATTLSLNTGSQRGGKMEIPAFKMYVDIKWYAAMRDAAMSDATICQILGHTPINLIIGFSSLLTPL